MNSIKKYHVNQQEFTFIELSNENIKATFMDYGATILSIFTKDKNGNRESILMAYESLDTYINNKMYLNCIVGPVAGRIKDASFEINNQSYTVEKNFLDTESLHSGDEGISFVFFDYEVTDNSVLFTYQKEPGKFPGTVKYSIKYTLQDNSLIIDFYAESDTDTLVNLTNHAYFNLSGNLKNDIMNHELTIQSSKALELDKKMVPIAIKDTTDTYLDFRKTRRIGDDFKEIDDPLLLDKVDYTIPQVTLKDLDSKRVMKVYTTYPCIVTYTHNVPDYETLLFGVEHKKHLGICFETQNSPNGINIEGVEDSILYKDKPYMYKTKLVFSVEE